MVGNIADLSGARIRGIPQVDTSWLGSLISSVEQAGQDINQARSFNGLADRIQGAVPAQQPAGGFLSGLMGKVAGNTSMPLPGAAGEIAATSPKVTATAPATGDTFTPFMNTIRAGGVQNPYALAAIAATGRAESGWSAANANRTWDDPSESGKPGRAGGIMSWRGPRYQALASTGDLSPEGQARFFLQEDPQLIQKLNGAKSVEEAQQLMNNSWAFAGYDRPGGESARRLGYAMGYLPTFQGSAPTEVASLDPSAGMSTTPSPAVTAPQAIEAAAPASGYIDPMVRVEPRADAAPYTMASATAPQPQQQAPAQAATAQAPSNGMIAQGVTPVQRGSVDPGLIQYMLRDRNLRDVGLKLWAANVEGQKATEPWQFVNLPDGTLARANQQTGAVERLGNFAKPNEDATVVGENLVRRSTGEVIYEGKPKTPASYQEFKLAQQEGFPGSFADWEKVKVPGSANVTVNAGEGDKFYENLDKKNAEMFSTLSDSGMNGRSRLAQLGQLEGLLQQSPSGAEAGLKLWLGDMGINSEGLDSLQATRALVEKMVPEQRQAGSGPMSDADIVMYRRSLPSVMNQPGGNELVLGTAKAIAEYDIKMGEIADAVADRSITPSEGRKRIRELENPLAGYTEQMRKLRGTDTNGRTPPRAPAPPSAPQAPAGVDPNLWRYMTPEERKLWQN